MAVYLSKYVTPQIFYSILDQQIRSMEQSIIILLVNEIPYHTHSIK